MQLRDNRSREPDMNLTPLIDVVFLLLIFFMVSTTFDRHSQLSLQLPSASVEPAEATTAGIQLSVDSDGRFYVNDRELARPDDAQLIAALREAAGGELDQPVRLSADARTTHQSVVKALDALAAVGLKNVEIATVSEDPAQ